MNGQFREIARAIVVLPERCVVYVLIKLISWGLAPCSDRIAGSRRLAASIVFSRYANTDSYAVPSKRFGESCVAIPTAKGATIRRERTR